MADEASAILFIIGLRELVSRIESNMPLCLCLCASKNQASGIKVLTMAENPQFIILVALCNRAQVHVFKNPSYYQVRRAILCFPCSHHKTKFKKKTINFPETSPPPPIRPTLLKTLTSSHCPLSSFVVVSISSPEYLSLFHNSRFSRDPQVFHSKADHWLTLLS